MIFVSAFSGPSNKFLMDLRRIFTLQLGVLDYYLNDERHRPEPERQPHFPMCLRYGIHPCRVLVST